MRAVRALFSPFNMVAGLVLAAVLLLQLVVGRPDAPQVSAELTKTTEAPQSVAVNLHFPDQSLRKDTLEVRRVSVGGSEAPFKELASRALEAWASGPTGGGLRLIPPNSEEPTVIVRYGAAYVSLPLSWRNLGGGSELEWWTICGIVDTLTDLKPGDVKSSDPGITTVLFLMNGMNNSIRGVTGAETLAGHVDLSLPFTKSVCAT